MADTFWSQGATEPRRNFKFLLTIGTRDNIIPLWVVKQVNLPKITVQEGSHKFLNHTFYFPGTIEYNIVSFTIVDAINVETSQKLLEGFVQSGYNTPTNAATAPEALLTKQDSINGLGAVRITQLGSGDDGSEGAINFILQNAWIKDLEFGQSLSYDNQDPSEIKVELRYDFFEFEGNDGNKLRGFGA